MDPATLLPYLTGPVGAIVVLIWVVWMQRKDLETERAAHEQTRGALATASARADAGIRAAELVASAVEGTTRRHGPTA